MSTAAVATRGDAGEAAVPVGPLLVLAGVTAALGALAATAGLLWEAHASGAVTSVHGVRVPLAGDGLYRHDSIFRAAGNRGTDVVSLTVGVPLMAAAAWLTTKRRPAGLLMLSGAFAWFLYVSASLALGTAYNELFLVYVAGFGAGLFGIIKTLMAARATLCLAPPPPATMPRMGLSLLMLTGGAVTTFVWVEPLVRAAAAGEPPPMLMHSTTMVTEALDLAVIAPSAISAGVLVLSRRWTGYVMAVPLAILLAVMAAAITCQTVFQLRAGWDFAAAEVVGPISGFLVLGTAAVWLSVRALVEVSRAPVGPPVP